MCPTQRVTVCSLSTSHLPVQRPICLLRVYPEFHVRLHHGHRRAQCHIRVWHYSFRLHVCPRGFHWWQPLHTFCMICLASQYSRCCLRRQFHLRHVSSLGSFVQIHVWHADPCVDRIFIALPILKCMPTITTFMTSALYVTVFTASPLFAPPFCTTAAAPPTRTVRRFLY